MKKGDKSTANAADVLNDLQIQSIMFNMTVDVEALTLTEPNDYKEPPWISKWKAHRQLKDFDEYFDIDREENGR